LEDSEALRPFRVLGGKEKRALEEQHIDVPEVQQLGKKERRRGSFFYGSAGIAL
jgi:hypothetical protein